MNLVSFPWFDGLPSVGQDYFLPTIGYVPVYGRLVFYPSGTGLFYFNCSGTFPSSPIVASDCPPPPNLGGRVFLGHRRPCGPFAVFYPSVYFGSGVWLTHSKLGGDLFFSSLKGDALPFYFGSSCLSMSVYPDFSQLKEGLVGG